MGNTFCFKASGKKSKRSLEFGIPKQASAQSQKAAVDQKPPNDNATITKFLESSEGRPPTPKSKKKNRPSASVRPFTQQYTSRHDNAVAQNPKDFCSTNKSRDGFPIDLSTDSEEKDISDEEMARRFGGFVDNKTVVPQRSTGRGSVRNAGILQSTGGNKPGGEGWWKRPNYFYGASASDKNPIRTTSSPVFTQQQYLHQANKTTTVLSSGLNANILPELNTSFKRSSYDREVPIVSPIRDSYTLEQQRQKRIKMGQAHSSDTKGSSNQNEDFINKTAPKFESNTTKYTETHFTGASNSRENLDRTFETTSSKPVEVVVHGYCKSFDNSTRIDLTKLKENSANKWKMDIREEYFKSLTGNNDQKGIDEKTTVSSYFKTPINSGNVSTNDRGTKYKDPGSSQTTSPVLEKQTVSAYGAIKKNSNSTCSQTTLSYIETPNSNINSINEEGRKYTDPNFVQKILEVCNNGSFSTNEDKECLNEVELAKEADESLGEDSIGNEVTDEDQIDVSTHEQEAQEDNKMKQESYEAIDEDWKLIISNSKAVLAHDTAKSFTAVDDLELWMKSPPEEISLAENNEASKLVENLQRIATDLKMFNDNNISSASSDSNIDHSINEHDLVNTYDTDNSLKKADEECDFTKKTARYIHLAQNTEEEEPSVILSSKERSRFYKILEDVKKEAEPFVELIDNYTGLANGDEYYSIEESLRRLIYRLDDLFDDVGNLEKTDDLVIRRNHVYEFVFPLLEERLPDRIQINKMLQMQTYSIGANRKFVSM